MMQSRRPAGIAQLEAAMTKVVRCSCGAELRSTDENELIAIVKEHATSAHNLTLTDEQIRAMMEIEQ
jgi:predicted small metal-binding protein